MGGGLSKRNRMGLVFLLAFLLTLGLSPGAKADTVCDDADLTFADFTPTVNPALLDGLLNLLGAIPIVQTFDVPIHLLYDHTLHLTVDSSIPLDEATYRVTAAMGSVKVVLDLLAWQDEMTIAVTHAPCGENNPLCEGEQKVIDEFLQWADNPGLSFTSATVTQIADVCVLQEECAIVYPLESTDAAINGFHLTLLPEGDPFSIGAWLNDYVSSLVNLADIIGHLENFFVTQGDEGVLINVFGKDIKTNNGCMPVPEKINCLTAGCSTVHQQRETMGRSVNLFLYGLPVAVMFGLLLWRRKR